MLNLQSLIPKSYGIISKLGSNKYTKTSYTTFVKQIKDDKIEHIDILPSKKIINFKQNNGVLGTTSFYFDEHLMNTIEEHDVSTNFIYNNISPYQFIDISLIIVAICTYILTQPNIKNKELDNDNIYIVEKCKITLKDIHCLDETKSDIIDIIGFFKNRNVLEQAGVEIPLGCLLSGPCGTNKKLIAQSIAGESNVPFISCSISTLIEVYVGVGASRIRSLFETARQLSPCVIYIDDIDKSSSTILDDNEIRQTLYQLCMEMDRENNNGILILAATNKIDSLDDELTKPGRFSRTLELSLPNKENRYEILNKYNNNDALINHYLADKCVGCSNDDLINIMNEATIISVRNDNKMITKQDIDSAFKRVNITQTIHCDSRRSLAYHEAGHAILGTLCTDFDIIDYITIESQPRTKFIPSETNELLSHNYLFNKLIVRLGGLIAETITFGDVYITSSSYEDIKIANSIAHLISKNCDENYNNSNMMSGSLLQYIDDDVSYLVIKAYDIGYNLLNDHYDKLEQIANLLIVNDTINSYEFYKIMNNRSCL